ncbi:MAG: hypothetical protein AAGF23_09920, partial [Acidobacteriota bacterium]
RMPENQNQQRDFAWIPRLGDIDPNVMEVDPSLVEGSPRPGLIAARLTLEGGSVSTERLIATSADGNGVVPVAFFPLGSDTEAGQTTDPGGAVADWVVAEIEVPADSVTLVEEHFSGDSGRSMRLEPKDGVIEIAVFNVTRSQFAAAPHNSVPPSSLKAGGHFELYYGLAKCDPPCTKRPVPHPATGTDHEPSETTPVATATESRLLKALHLTDTERGPYNVVLCPPSRF